MFRSARWRLVTWNVLVLTFILLLLEAVVYTVFSRQVYGGADTELQSRENRAVQLITRYSGQFDAVYAALGSAPADPTYRTFISGSNGIRLSSECNTIFPACPPPDPTSQAALREVQEKAGTDIRTTSFRGYPQRVLTFSVAVNGMPYVIQISRTASGEAEALHNLRLLLFLGGLLGIVLSGVGSLFLARKALVPIGAAFSRQRQFTADASHELRTPLALIRATAEMLERHADRLPPGDEELVVEIIRETDHLNRLVGDLLTLARADAETVTIDSKPVDFRSLVGEVHEDVQRIAESRGIESDVTLNGPIVVPGDETRLRQLLLILLDNALKYTDPGGRVDVSLQRQDGRARLLVSDTGIGISAEDLPHIFDRFYRVDSAREHESGGTGLGLSIAEWIVQAHHGTIKAESDPGKGTRFQVDLPAS